MKTFISDIIPRIQKFSKKLDDLTLLTNQQWVVIDEIDNAKTVYIFRQNNELLISKNGKVEKAKWEYLGNNLLLIDRKDESYLFKHGFFDENILALKIDGKDEYAFLVNETKFDKELNTLENVFMFLNEKYLDTNVKQSIQDATGFKIIGNTTYSKSITYIAPSHSINKICEYSNWFTGKTEKYLIEFDDNEKGEIYLRLNDKHAYFKGLPNGFWIKVTCLYVDMDSCINALHDFLKTKNLLSDGLIDTY
jgi:hypothetical protein